jgi:hypothetical protein
MRTKPRQSGTKQRMQNGNTQRMPAQNQADESCIMDRYREEVASTVAEHPLSTTLGVFAIGLTLGVALGAALGTSHHSDRRRMAESFGRRVLDTLHDYVPDSMQQYLHA